MTNARYSALTGALGLSVNDLAEIGGFSDRFARDLVAGRRPFPQDVKSALDALDKDTGALVDEIIADFYEGGNEILVFRSNADLRSHFPDRPCRGHSTGGFVGPHRIASLAAAEKLSAEGVKVDLLFYDTLI